MCQIAAAIPAKIYQENVMVKPEMHCACRQAGRNYKGSTFMWLTPPCWVMWDRELHEFLIVWVYELCFWFFQVSDQETQGNQ